LSVRKQVAIDTSYISIYTLSWAHAPLKQVHSERSRHVTDRCFLYC